MYIGIDVGGTKIRFAAFTSFESPKLIQTLEIATINDYKKDLANITSFVSRFVDQNIEGIGIGLPGTIDNSSTLSSAPNLRKWEGKDVAKDLNKQFSCKIVVENDATAAALGEAVYGYGTKKDFLFVTWGSGIGGTYIRNINNQIYVFPCEIGAQVLEWDGVDNDGGQRGCMEAYSGGKGIARLYGKSPIELDEDNWREVEMHFAHGLFNALTLSPVPLVIFSGSIVFGQEKRLKTVRKIVESRLRVISVPEFMLSHYRENTGVYGALSLFKPYIKL